MATTEAVMKGLPGTTRDLEAVFIRNVSKVPRVIQAGKCATAADDNGSISVWIDDDGRYRCEAYRHFITIEKKMPATINAVKEWYSEWLEKIA